MARCREHASQATIVCALGALLHINTYILLVTCHYQHTKHGKLTVHSPAVHRRFQLILHIARVIRRIADSHTARRRRALINTVLERRLFVRATNDITAVEEVLVADLVCVAASTAVLLCGQYGGGIWFGEGECTRIGWRLGSCRAGSRICPCS